MAAITAATGRDQTVGNSVAWRRAAIPAKRRMGRQRFWSFCRFEGGYDLCREGKNNQRGSQKMPALQDFLAQRTIHGVVAKRQVAWLGWTKVQVQRDSSPVVADWVNMALSEKTLDAEGEQDEGNEQQPNRRCPFAKDRPLFLYPAHCLRCV